MENEVVAEWVNQDPLVKEFIGLAKQYYTGSVKFFKNGMKLYTAKLDPRKLKLEDCAACEAYFDINKERFMNKDGKDVFFLRMVEAGNEINITLL